MAALTKSAVIGVVGAGTMGAGIAQIAAAFGHTVRLFDQDFDAVARGISGVEKGLARLVERGKFSQHEVDDLVARIKPAKSLNDLADCALIVEAIVENLEIKQAVFAEIEALCSAETILASNTSSITITAIAKENV